MSAEKRESVGSFGILGNLGAPGGEEKSCPREVGARGARVGVGREVGFALGVGSDWKGTGRERAGDGEGGSRAVSASTHTGTSGRRPRHWNCI